MNDILEINENINFNTIKNFNDNNRIIIDIDSLDSYIINNDNDIKILKTKLNKDFKILDKETKKINEKNDIKITNNFKNYINSKRILFNSFKNYDINDNDIIKNNLKNYNLTKNNLVNSLENYIITNNNTRLKVIDNLDKEFNDLDKEFDNLSKEIDNLSKECIKKTNIKTLINNFKNYIDFKEILKDSLVNYHNDNDNDIKNIKNNFKNYNNSKYKLTINLKNYNNDKFKFIVDLNKEFNILSEEFKNLSKKIKYNAKNILEINFDNYTNAKNILLNDLYDNNDIVSSFKKYKNTINKLANNLKKFNNDKFKVKSNINKNKIKSIDKLKRLKEIINIINNLNKKIKLKYENIDNNDLYLDSSDFYSQKTILDLLNLFLKSKNYKPISIRTLRNDLSFLEKNNIIKKNKTNKSNSIYIYNIISNDYYKQLDNYFNNKNKSYIDLSKTIEYDNNLTIDNIYSKFLLKDSKQEIKNLVNSLFKKLTIDINKELDTIKNRISNIENIINNDNIEK